MLTEQEKQRRQEAIEFATAINLIEGVPLPEDTTALFAQWANGDITHAELKAIILEQCRRPVV